MRLLDQWEVVAREGQELGYVPVEARRSGIVCTRLLSAVRECSSPVAWRRHDSEFEAPTDEANGDTQLPCGQLLPHVGIRHPFIAVWKECLGTPNTRCPGLGVFNLQPRTFRIADGLITWPAAALALASIALMLSIIGQEVGRRRRLKKYRDKIVADLRSSGNKPDPERERRLSDP